nr:MAG TPA: hypothetical protein [Bacteriophage sp.]
MSSDCIFVIFVIFIILRMASRYILLYTSRSRYAFLLLYSSR